MFKLIDISSSIDNAGSQSKSEIEDKIYTDESDIILNQQSPGSFEINITSSSEIDIDSLSDCVSESIKRNIEYKNR